ncbi:hypothetical protein NX059_011403 [Plenodomus lindquistii]|nr:hypothetical protein NX059_011403 [Plenodomus lindquistii]
MEVMVMAVRMEMEDIRCLVAATAGQFSMATFPQVFDVADCKEDNLTKVLERIQEIHGQFSRLSYSRLPVEEPPSIKEVSEHGTVYALSKILRIVVPLTIDLRHCLDKDGAQPDLLERFCSSDAAKLLGSDFANQRRLALEDTPSQLLPESKGRIADETTVQEGLTVGKYWTRDGADVAEVVLEYRSYASQTAHSGGSEVLEDLVERAQMLATYLELATSTDPNESIAQMPLSSLRCLGWKHDKDLERFVLIYKNPQSLDSQAPLKLLRNWVTDYGQWPLDRIFFTAYQISLAMFDLHMCGWVHKNLNPSNIILCASPSTAQPSHSGSSTLRYPIPILKGFEFSRKQNKFSNRLAMEDEENNVYRHPNRQGLPRDKAEFGQYHDIYAVGTVLFELGRNKSIQNVLGKEETKRTPDNVRRKLLEETKQNVSRYVGTAFASCVMRCLKGDFGKMGNEQPLEGQLLALAFRRLVVDDLKRMAFACGAFVT